MKWIQEIFKLRSIRRYLARLPKHLQQKHGKAEHYSPEQVLQAIKDKRLNQHFAIYAIVALSDATASEQYAHEQQLSDDISRIRTEIGEHYLGGNPDFTIDDINAYSAAGDGHSANDSQGGD